MSGRRRRSERSMGGMHFNLGSDLRVRSAQSHGRTPVATNSGLRNLANTKHLATYSQPVQGPLTLDTYKQMARKVHANRPGMPSSLNTVGIFHESSLPRAKQTRGGLDLNVSRAVVMTSNKTANTVTYQRAQKMQFGTFSQKHHFKGLK